MSGGRVRAAGGARLAAALLLGACGSGEGGEDRVAVRDSAGVRIVENPGRAAPLGFRVDSVPLLDLGGDEEGGGFHLVSDAVRLADGRIVVASAGTRELRLFAPDGRPVGSLGRRGRGPGEFEELEWVHALPGGGLAAWDGALGRLSVFDSAGAFLRVASTPERLGFYPEALGMLGDGRVVLSSGFDGRIPSGVEVWRDTASVLVVDLASGTSTPVGRFPRSEHIAARPGRALMVHPRAFGRATRVAAGAERIYVSTGEAHEIRAYDGGGRLRTLIRVAAPPVPVTPRDIQDYRDRLLSFGAPPELREAQRRLLEAMPFPETMPPVRSLELDPGGGLWVEEPRRAAGAGGSLWRVLGPDGRALGTVELPEMQVKQIGRDFVLGVAVDVDGVEHVRLHRLRRQR